VTRQYGYKEISRPFPWILSVNLIIHSPERKFELKITSHTPFERPGTNPHCVGDSDKQKYSVEDPENQKYGA
jgi:hypothetical protein